MSVHKDKSYSNLSCTKIRASHDFNGRVPRDQSYSYVTITGKLTNTKVDKVRVAFVYSTTQGWKLVDIPSEELLKTETLPNNIEIVFVDLIDLDDMVPTLQSLYNNGIRYFVGFSGSELVDRTGTFFLDNKDAFMFSSGSTVTNLTYPNANIFRLTLTDRENLTALQTLFAPTNFTVLYEKNNFWAESYNEDIIDALGPSNVASLEIDTTNLNLVEIDNFVNANPSNNLFIIVSLNVNVLDILIPMYNTKTIYMGDGSYDYEFQSDVSMVTMHLPIYWGYDNTLLQKYGNPFVVNLYDSLLIVSETISTGTPVENIAITGFNGDTSFTTNKVRKFGRIASTSYKTSWEFDFIYGSDSLGIYSSPLT